MKVFAETSRLIMREIVPSDEKAFFELDADPQVHKFLGTSPLKNTTQVRKMIAFIRQQYSDTGIGRWAIVNRETNDFMGWAGLKFIIEETNNHNHYYDLGYRLIRKYWGMGYATEAAQASVKYGFEELKLNEIFAIADSRNYHSHQVLSKTGMAFVEEFELQGTTHRWYMLKNRNAM